jgi:hypothetical protein
MHACVVGASQIVSGFTILGMHLRNRDSSNGIVVDYANKQGRVKEGSRGRAVSAVIFDRRGLMRSWGDLKLSDILQAMRN